MAKNMEATIVHRGYMGITEEQLFVKTNLLIQFEAANRHREYRSITVS